MIKVLTKEVLIEEYVNNHKSQIRIAREYGVSEPTVYRKLKKYGIEKRKYTHSLRDNHVKLTKPLLDLIEGELLGDGCIYMRRPFRSAKYVHGTKHEKYLEWLFEELEKYGLEKSGTPHKTSTRGVFGKSITYSNQTKTYIELKNLYYKWYPKGGKIIPYNLGLTPIKIRQWFIGDGHYEKNRYVHFATYQFELVDVKHLANLIENNVKIKPVVVSLKGENFGHSYAIRIDKRYLYDFFKYIGDCPYKIKDIYGKKFPSKIELYQLQVFKEKEDFADKTYRNPKWLTERWKEGLNRKEIAEMCGVSEGTITYNFRKSGAKKNNKMSFLEKYRNASFKDKNWLEKQLKVKSVRQIARDEGVSHTTILDWKNKFEL